MQCPKCGSDRVIPDVHILDYGQWQGQLTARVDTNPDAIVFKGPMTSQLRGRVCGDCGFVELFVQNPGTLYKAWQKSTGE
jgi:hypothetical protein